MGHLVCVYLVILSEKNTNKFLFCSWELQFFKFYTTFVQRNGLLFYGLLFALRVRIIQHQFEFILEKYSTSVWTVYWVNGKNIFSSLSRMIVMISWVSFWLRADSAPRVTLGEHLVRFRMNEHEIVKQHFIVIICRYQYDVNIHYIEFDTQSNIAQSELHQNVRSVVRCMLSLHFQ